MEFKFEFVAFTQRVWLGLAETPYVESACFSKMQVLTASDTPHGSYRVLGTLYTMDVR